MGVQNDTSIAAYREVVDPSFVGRVTDGEVEQFAVPVDRQGHIGDMDEYAIEFRDDDHAVPFRSDIDSSCLPVFSVARVAWGRGNQISRTSGRWSLRVS
jgi:hypothetical protein